MGVTLRAATSARPLTLTTRAAPNRARTGTVEETSEQKKGYKLPRHIMTNGDLARVINSDEVQSVVAPPKAGGRHAPLKKNPLRK